MKATPYPDFSDLRPGSYEYRGKVVSLADEHWYTTITEDEPARHIAGRIAENMRERGLRDIPEDVITALIMNCLDDYDYRIVRRNPPPMPEDSRAVPVTMTGPDSLLELEEIITDIQDQEDIREAQGAQPGWVYYLEVGDRIKIGFSKTPGRRLKAYPPGSKLLAIHPGTRELEHEMHHQFRDFLADGREWFTPNPALADHIAQVSEQFGELARKFQPTYQRKNTHQIKPSYWSGK